MKLSCLLRSSVFVGLAGCWGERVDAIHNTHLPGIVVAPPSASMHVGDTLRFAASVTGPGVDQRVAWRSSNAALVTVDGAGLATALAVGAASVVATSKADTTQSGNAAVRVASKP